MPSHGSKANAAGGMDYEVIISIEDDMLYYSLPNLPLNRLDTVRWSCSRGPFAIQFDTVSPLPLAALQATESTEQQSVWPEAQPGTYSYACSVYDRRTERVYLDAACPAIIIQR